MTTTTLTSEQRAALLDQFRFYPHKSRWHFAPHDDLGLEHYSEGYKTRREAELAAQRWIDENAARETHAAD